MRVFDKKGSRGPPPDHPSRDLANLAKLHLIHRWLMRLNPSNHGGGKCHLQCVNIDQAANGGRDKQSKVPRCCLLPVLAQDAFAAPVLSYLFENTSFALLVHFEMNSFWDGNLLSRG